MELDNILDVVRPKFEDGKYVLYIHYTITDMSVGMYGSNLGTGTHRVEYNSKFDAWGDYLKYKEMIK